MICTVMRVRRYLGHYTTKISVSKFFIDSINIPSAAEVRLIRFMDVMNVR